MKTLIKFLFILCITSCTAQTPKNKKKATPLTDKEIIKKGYQIKKEDTIFMKDGKLDIAKLENEGISSGSTKPFSYEYEAKLDSGTYINILGNRESGYGKYVKFSKDDYFKYGYSYFSSGELNGYGIEYVKFFKKGVWYDCDIQGNIEKYEDYDAPYDFSWEDIQKFLQEKKIKKEEITKIHRSNLTGKYQWGIIYKPTEFLNSDNVRVLTLDAKTGKILKEETRDVSRRLD